MRSTTGTILFLFFFLLVFPSGGQLLAATIFVDGSQALGPVNQLLFGNAQPYGYGEFLLETDSGTFDSRPLELVSALRPTVLRFPGSPDHYFWEDGIGPARERPDPRPGQLEHGFRYGTDEHLALCEEIGAEGFFIVNYLTGIMEDTLSKEAPLGQRVNRAADWVEYCNAPDDGSNPNGGIDWAKRRTQNGHPEPYDVKFWAVGSELYNSWADVCVLDYAQDIIAFSEAMKGVDPTIKVGATAPTLPHAKQWEHPGAPEWTATLLQMAHQDIDFLDFHLHYPGSWGLPDSASREDLFKLGLAGANQAFINLREVKNIIGQKADSPIGIVPGGNGLFYGEQYPHQWAASLLAGIYYADLLMMFLQQGLTLNIDFACAWAMQSPHGNADIGYEWWPQSWHPRPRYYAQLMLRDHCGDFVVRDSVSCYTFSTIESAMPALENVPELSVCASIDSAGATMYLVVINKQLDQAVEAEILIEGFEPQPEAQLWTLNGPSITAHNEDDADNVIIVPSTLAPVSTSFTYTFPAHSLTAVKLHKSGTQGLAGFPSDPMPRGYQLCQNFPNPFNGSTNIRYHLVEETSVELRIYNALGQLVRTLVQERQPPGEHQISWDARNDRGEEVTSGVYFCSLQADEFGKTCKMTLLR